MLRESVILSSNFKLILGRSTSSQHVTLCSFWCVCVCVCAGCFAMASPSALFLSLIPGQGACYGPDRLQEGPHVSRIRWVDVVGGCACLRVRRNFHLLATNVNRVPCWLSTASLSAALSWWVTSSAVIVSETESLTVVKLSAVSDVSRASHLVNSGYRTISKPLHTSHTIRYDTIWV